MKYTGDMNDVLKMIKHVMVDTDTKQKEIVESTGLNKGTVSNFLNGKSSNPTLDTLKMYANAMGCELYIDFVKQNNDSNENT